VLSIMPFYGITRSCVLFLFATSGESMVQSQLFVLSCVRMPVIRRSLSKRRLSVKVFILDMWLHPFGYLSSIWRFKFSYHSAFPQPTPLTHLSVLFSTLSPSPQIIPPHPLLSSILKTSTYFLTPLDHFPTQLKTLRPLLSDTVVLANCLVHLLRYSTIIHTTAPNTTIYRSDAVVSAMYNSTALDMKLFSIYDPNSPPGDNLGNDPMEVKIGMSLTRIIQMVSNNVEF